MGEKKSKNKKIDFFSHPTFSPQPNRELDIMNQKTNKRTEPIKKSKKLELKRGDKDETLMGRIE